MNEINQLLIKGIEAISQVPPHAWEYAGELIIASGILSPLLILTKKLAKIKREQLMAVTVVLASFAVASLLYLYQLTQVNPALAGFIVVGVSNLFYYFLFKPLTKRTAPKLHDFVENVRAVNKQKSVQKTNQEIPGKITADFSS